MALYFPARPLKGQREHATEGVAYVDIPRNPVRITPHRCLGDRPLELRVCMFSSVVPVNYTGIGIPGI